MLSDAGAAAVTCALPRNAMTRSRSTEFGLAKALCLPNDPPLLYMVTTMETRNIDTRTFYFTGSTAQKPRLDPAGAATYSHSLRRTAAH